MRRMHRPDPKRPPDLQDKRSVVQINLEDVDVWLFGTLEAAKRLMSWPALEQLDAAPASVPA